MKTVEEYQDQTEERWRGIVTGDGPSGCGWCAFTRDVGAGSVHCGRCPVLRVFGQVCVDIPQVRAYYDASPYGPFEQEAAEACLKLAQERREDLIVAAKAILEEVADD